MERRLKWLRKRNLVDCVQPVIPSGTLKTAAISQIFKDASHDELLDLQKYVQWELFKRGRDVKVVLSTYDNSFEQRCSHHDVYVAVIKPIISEYVAINYPNVTEIQRSNIVEFVADAMNLPSLKHFKEHEFIEKYGMSIEQLALAYTGFQITMSSIDDPQEDEPPVYKEWRKYLSMSITNPYLISAVEELQTKGVKLSMLILTTIRVPYGKVIKEHFDTCYGDYVEFVNEDEEDSSEDEDSGDDYPY